MNQDFKKYLELAVNEGVLSDSNRVLLIKKGQQLGIDEIEVELLIENYLFEQSKKLSEVITDDYDISDDELVIRLSNYTSKLKEYRATIQLDPFPEKLTAKGKVGAALNTGRKALASLTKADILTDSMQLAGKYSPIPGGKFVQVKKKCKKFPYCNQGDINALKIFKNEGLKKVISNISESYGLTESYIRNIIYLEMEKLNKH